MLDTPVIVQTTSLITATIHVVATLDKIQEVMGPGLQEIFAAIAAQGLTPAGNWFTHHHQRPTDAFDFDICVPITSPVVATGRVLPGEWPAMKVARTVYHGPYEGLGKAWGDFLDWIEANDLKQSEELWERYLTGPDSTPEPTEWRTELNRPLLD